MFSRSVLTLLFAVVLATLISVQLADARNVPSKKRDERVAEQKRSSVMLQERDLSRLRFPYGQKKVRGVGLGGWLVLENFITPSLYEQADDDRVIDEWSFGRYVDEDKAHRILKHHYDTFITEDDFEQIASYGLNHVRVPFPYWGIKTYPNEPYVKVNQYDKLKEAAGWAKKHNLAMIIELHTVPGGQNPFDHSGHTNNSNWLGNSMYEKRWLNILDELVSEFSKDKYSAVTGISIVNEPMGDMDQIVGQYHRGYNQVRSSEGNKDLLVIFGDIFQDPAQGDTWNNKLQAPTYNNVALDSHVYRIFDTNSIKLDVDDRVEFFCGLKDGFGSGDHVWTLVGEWSPSYTDCAKGLNGRHKGARYDGTFPGSQRVGSCKGKSGNADNFSNAVKNNLKRMWEAQADAFEGGIGWIMWTWKTQGHTAEDWSYLAGVRHGWIPRDPSKRDFKC